jgi:hypothetical protein
MSRRLARPSPVIDSIRFDRRVIPCMRACVRAFEINRIDARITSIDRSIDRFGGDA